MLRTLLAITITTFLIGCVAPQPEKPTCRHLSRQDRWGHWMLSGIADLHPDQGPWRRYRFLWRQQGQHVDLTLPGPLGMPGRHFQGLGDQLWQVGEQQHPYVLQPWHHLWSAVFNSPRPGIQARGWSCQPLGYTPDTLIWHGPHAWLKLWHLRWLPASQNRASDSH